MTKAPLSWPDALYVAALGCFVVSVPLWVALVADWCGR